MMSLVLIFWLLQKRSHLVFKSLFNEFFFHWTVDNGRPGPEQNSRGSKIAIATIFHVPCFKVQFKAICYTTVVYN
jgi:hypothetical protein